MKDESQWHRHPLVTAVLGAVVATVISIPVSVLISQSQIDSSERAVRETITANDKSVRASLRAQDRGQRRGVAAQREAERRQGRRSGYEAFQTAASQFIGCLGDCKEHALRRADAVVQTALDRLKLDASPAALALAARVATDVRGALNQASGNRDLQPGSHLFFKLQEDLDAFGHRVTNEIG